MREPALVAECVAAMADAVKFPVTVKCRIGVDEQEPREALFALVEAVRGGRGGGRGARPQGLARRPEPQGKPTIPPLDYRARAYIEGGASAPADRDQRRLRRSRDGARATRVARRRHDRPGRLPEPRTAARRRSADFGARRRSPTRSRRSRLMRPISSAELARGRACRYDPPSARPVRGRPGARLYRRKLATLATRPERGLAVLREAVGAVARKRSRKRCEPRFPARSLEPRDAPGPPGAPRLPRGSLNFSRAHGTRSPPSPFRNGPCASEPRGKLRKWSTVPRELPLGTPLFPRDRCAAWRCRRPSPRSRRKMLTPPLFVMFHAESPRLLAVPAPDLRRRAPPRLRRCCLDYSEHL